MHAVMENTHTLFHCAACVMEKQISIGLNGNGNLSKLYRKNTMVNATSPRKNASPNNHIVNYISTHALLGWYGSNHPTGQSKHRKDD